MEFRTPARAASAGMTTGFSRCIWVTLRFRAAGSPSTTIESSPHSSPAASANVCPGRWGGGGWRVSLSLLRHIPIAARCACQHQRPIRVQFTAEAECPSLLPGDGQSFTQKIRLDSGPDAPVHSGTHEGCSSTKLVDEGEEEKADEIPPRVFHQKAAAALQPPVLSEPQHPPTSSKPPHSVAAAPYLDTRAQSHYSPASPPSQCVPVDVSSTNIHTGTHV